MEEIDSSKWYTLQVMSGQEKRVVDSLTARNARAEAEGIDTGLREILVPTSKIVERVNHKEVIRDQKLFPGYVFVRARIYDENDVIIPENWQFFSETKGVISFMGGKKGDKPIPLNDAEVEALRRNEEESVKPKPPQIWKVGDVVIIKEGAFENIEGVIESNDEERQLLGLSVTIFGRSTKVDNVPYWNVERPPEE